MLFHEFYSLTWRLGYFTKKEQQVPPDMMIVFEHYINQCHRYIETKEWTRFKYWETGDGIWIEKSIIFSIYGNLKNTITNLVHKSKAGFTSKELEKIIRKSCKNEIYELYKEGKLLRIKQRKEYIYLSNDFKIAKDQLQARHQMHPKRRLYFDGKFMEHLLLIISTSIRKIIKELMDKNNIEDPTGEKIEILIANSIRPLINGGRTDKEFARFF